MISRATPPDFSKRDAAAYRYRHPAAFLQLYHCSRVAVLNLAVNSLSASLISPISATGQARILKIAQSLHFIDTSTLVRLQKICKASNPTSALAYLRL